ncbi:MAG: hypothetical protein ABSC06_30505 [Rhodopila sp.]
MARIASVLGTIERLAIIETPPLHPGGTPRLEDDAGRWRTWAVDVRGAQTPAEIAAAIYSGKKPLIDRVILNRNEGKKLLANGIDRASTAVLTTGLLGPLASRIYGAATGINLPLDIQVTWFLEWTLLAILIHILAKWIFIAEGLH